MAVTNLDVHYSSKKMDWETPQDFFNRLDGEFHFTLDAAANSINKKCERYFTEKENGLIQDWQNETVWLNPPYGRVLAKWVEKAYNEGQKKNTTVVMLIPSRTDTRYFHNFIYGKAEIRFIKGRLKFVGAKDDAPFPSMVVIYR